MLTFLATLTRWKDWNKKIPPVFTAGYIWILLQTPPSAQAVECFTALVGFGAALLAFVFAINDFYDQDVDKRAGKPNAISELSLKGATIWLIGLAGTGVLILAPFYQQQWVAIFMVISYVLAATYSMPPLRFKERRLAGLLVAATHRTLPVFVGMAIFDDFQLSSWLLVANFILVGIRWNIVHQLIDLQNDEQTQVDTFTRAHGYDRAAWLMQVIVFPLELACLLAWFVLVSLKFPAVFLLAPAYGVWWLLTLWRREDGPMVTWTRYNRIPLGDFYEDFCPLFLGVLLAIREPIYLVLLCFQIIWQRHRTLRSLWDNKLSPALKDQG